VKLANLAGVKRGERELATRLQIDAATGDAVKKSLEEMKGAGQLRGIPVVVAK
jgi:indolepyruvate ferredoxin oxidoreductase